jgi:tripartite-type tricarboxylate transporter receptor subunit TctC
MRVLLLWSLAISFAGAECAQAQSYPSRSIRWVVAVSPGAGADIVARLLAPELSQLLGQQVVVDNRPGASSMIGAAIVAKAPTDGYTWLFGSGQQTINPGLLKKMQYDIVNDFAPVTPLVFIRYFLMVHPAVPAKSVKELIALAKTRPGQLNFGSGGTGGTGFLSGALLQVMADINMVHVPYKASALALTDLLGGHLDLSFPSITGGIPFYKTGKLRGLGVTSPLRHPSIPDIPTIAEAALPGYEMQSWFGILVPAGTPRDIVNRINAVAVKLVNTPTTKAALIAQGTDPETDTPEGFARLIKDELARNVKLLRAIGVEAQ